MPELKYFVRERPVSDPDAVEAAGSIFVEAAGSIDTIETVDPQRIEELRPETAVGRARLSPLS